MKTVLLLVLGVKFSVFLNGSTLPKHWDYGLKILKKLRRNIVVAKGNLMYPNDEDLARQLDNQRTAADLANSRADRPREIVYYTPTGTEDMT